MRCDAMRYIFNGIKVARVRFIYTEPELNITYLNILIMII